MSELRPKIVKRTEASRPMPKDLFVIGTAITTMTERAKAHHFLLCQKT